MSIPNYFLWLANQRTNAAMDAAPFQESNVIRTGKGQKGGGQFAKKPETLAKEDSRDNLDPNEGASRPAMTDDDWDAADDAIKEAKRVSPYVPKYGKPEIDLVEDDGECNIILPYENMGWQPEEKPSYDSPGVAAGWDDLEDEVERDFKAMQEALKEKGFVLEKEDKAVSSAVGETVRDMESDLRMARGDPEAPNIDTSKPSVTLRCKIRKAA